jgi:hypothetical protein
VLTQPTQETLAEVYRVRREPLLLRRMYWPQRDVLIVTTLQRRNGAAADPAARVPRPPARKAASVAGRRSAQGCVTALERRYDQDRDTLAAS